MKVEVSGPQNHTPTTDGPLEVRIVVDSPDVRKGTAFLGITEGAATPVFMLRRDVELGPGETAAWCSIPRLPLPRGRFYVWTGIFDGTGRSLLSWQPVAQFDVAGPDLDVGPRGVVRLAPVYVEGRWDVEPS
jgi:ABC-2 type transport system ATP-binding protein